MVDAQTISIIFAGISIGIAAIYYTLTLRNSQRAQQLQLETRQAQLFMNLYENYRSPEFRKIYADVLFRWEWTNLDDFWEKYGDQNNPEASAMFTSVLTFFEGLGLLLHKELVDVEMVNELMGRTLINIWEKFEAVNKEYGERRAKVHGIPGFKPWPWYEFLYYKVRPLPRGEGSADHST